MIERIPFPSYTDEASLRAAVTPILRRSFHVHEEVWGTHCSGKRLRIDAVLVPVDPVDWKDTQPAVGVEFKMPRNDPGYRDFTRWAAQAVSYTHVDWDGWGRLMVFACPSPMMFRGPMAHLLGQLGVGELTPVRYHGWTLLLNEHRMWSERGGIREANRWSLRPRVGA